MLTAVSEDSGGNPPQEQLRILHGWVCRRDVFEAKQQREDAWEVASCINTCVERCAMKN
ncbi:hypothetical protein J1N35_003521 [Gossypium stocksii]|uniref:Uncharacterized protein n=1 Tax=Gossypium stocksii TaxID=47602 RepID=A0A9D3WAL9_9ROSI|nr:hypothetical protein J1N35_003521 [Gossypium stocksii]